MKSASQLIIFEATNQPVQVRLEGETLWLSQTQMAQLFDTSTDNISLHLKNIYSEGELEEKATTEDFSVVRQEGSRQVQRRIEHYNTGYHHLHRLPGQFHPCHALSPMGHAGAAPAFDPRLQPGSRAV